MHNTKGLVSGRPRDRVCLVGMHLKKRWIDRRVYEYFAVNVAPYLGWRDPILVYQMGKVGSSSIRNSLFRCTNPSTKLVLMSHEFFPVRSRNPKDIDIEASHREDVVREIEHDKEVFQRFSLRKRLGWRFRERFYSERIYKAYVRPGGPFRAVTLVRDPIANNVSMFFEVLDHYTGASAEECRLTTEELIEVFLDRYMHSRPLTWLDAELKRTLGIDVFQHPFDRAKGYSIIREGKRSLLTIKCELDDRRKASALCEFLGLERLDLVRSNVSAKRAHGRQYAQFLERLHVPRRLLDRMYESKYARFFYTDEELSQFRKRWE